ncbi:MAG TPA: hypothetical protein VLX68_02175 [Chitinivibrionales bacterium]|nr:hypothetical protein [Chitinivibrionales bacterium]
MRLLTTRTKVSLAAALAAVFSCAVFKPGLVGQDALSASASEMSVSGRSGETFKRTIVFGPFHTNTFSIGKPTISHNMPRSFIQSDDITRFTSATQGFHFTQFDSSGDSIAVECLDTRNAKTATFGSLMTYDTSSETYDIWLTKGSAREIFVFTKGKPLAVTLGKDTVTMAYDYKQDAREKRAFWGVLFARPGETVTAVNLMDKGTVWMKKDLDKELKLLIAALSTAMLVKPDLENTSSR